MSGREGVEYQMKRKAERESQKIALGNWSEGEEENKNNSSIRGRKAANNL